MPLCEIETGASDRLSTDPHPAPIRWAGPGLQLAGVERHAHQVALANVHQVTLVRGVAAAGIDRVGIGGHQHLPVGRTQRGHIDAGTGGQIRKHIIDEMLAVGQELRPEMGVFISTGMHLGEGLRFAPVGGDAVQRAALSGREYDGPVRVPRAAAGERPGVADLLRGSAPDRNPLQRIVGEERDIFAIRRPEGCKPAFGSRNRTGLQQIERAQPQHGLPVRPFRLQYDVAPIGRNRRHPVDGLQRRCELELRHQRWRARPAWQRQSAPVAQPGDAPNHACQSDHCQRKNQPHHQALASGLVWHGLDLIRKLQRNEDPGAPGPHIARLYRARQHFPHQRLESRHARERAACQLQLDHRILCALPAPAWFLFDATGDHAFHSRMYRRLALQRGRRPFPNRLVERLPFSGEWTPPAHHLVHQRAVGEDVAAPVGSRS